MPNKLFARISEMHPCCRMALVLALFLVGMGVGMVAKADGYAGAFVAKFDQQTIPGLIRDSDNIGMMFGYTWEGEADFGVGIDGYFFNNSNGQDVYLQWEFDDTLSFQAGVGRMGSHARAMVNVDGVDVMAGATGRADTQWVQTTIRVHDNASVFLRVTKATFDYNFTASRTEKKHGYTVVHTGSRSDTVDDTYVWFGVNLGF